MAIVMQAERAAEPTLTDGRELPFEFTGTHQEYFSIWFINVLLSVVTLGIWSAWAKVRQERWVSGHTLLDGSSLEYDATGAQILTGRAFVFLMTFGYVFLANLFPQYEWVMALAVLAVTPALVNRGLRFAARVKGWRGVRGDFSGSYLKTLGVILLPIACVLTLGLAAPFGFRAAVRYLASNLTFGGKRFEALLPTRRLFGILGRTYLVMLLFLALVVLAFFLGIAIDSGHREDGSPSLSVLPNLACIYLFIGAVSVYFTSSLANLTINHSILDGRHRFRSDVSPWRYLWIVISGWIATILTLGLMHPWAQVRRWRYVLSRRAVIVRGPLGDFDIARPESGEGVFSSYGALDGVGVGF